MNEFLGDLAADLADMGLIVSSQGQTDAIVVFKDKPIARLSDNGEVVHVVFSTECTPQMAAVLSYYASFYTPLNINTEHEFKAVALENIMIH